MKIIGKISLCLAVFLLIPTIARAGSVQNDTVGTPTWSEYANNQTLSADILNNHFDSIAEAVNDNYIRLMSGHFTIPARGGFVHTSVGDNFSSCDPSSFQWNGIGENRYYAMVNLPQDSVITAVTYYFWRNLAATAETTATLFRQTLPAIDGVGSEQIIAVTSDTSNSGHSSKTEPVSTNNVVDNQNYSYFVAVHLPEIDTLCVDGVIISYSAPPTP